VAIPQFTKYKRNAVVAKAQANLTTCITELAAQFATETNSTFDCIIGKDSSDADIDVALEIDEEGNVAASTADDLVNMDMEGYDVTCTISNDNGNRVACNATL
jgi:hypothetical protein